MARASRIHAATSLTAAADMAILPISVVRSFSSANIRAKTGKAVIERETPINTRNEVPLTPFATVFWRTNDVPIPNANGRLIPANAMPRACFPVRRRDLGSNSRPERNKKNMRPRFARVSNTVTLLGGNMACNILWTTNAHEVWVDLRDRFSQKNAPRIFEIRRAISNNAQNTNSVSQYYTTLKAYRDELSSYRTPPNCTCGAMKTHTELLDSDALMDFLQGLNESYASVRSQILLMDPLPSMAKAYFLILQEERQ
ncbi:hypothetical protein RJ639_016992 [Escallonia herrerae]|uniref:Retrotransposon gag domain-containing protein n=1 Tax=Escallonia herrerae TaxID=1293975 RepID=A0AA88VAQ4_9ASTE|nr:hypothetical protein RJ639_016992 [Escallonia herrerae]